MNFIKDLVAYDNVKSLFRCLGWNKHYKHIYNAIEVTKSENWNHLFSAFGKEFFDNTKRRDRIFKYVRKLDSKEGLDDLSRVLTALNKTNFYDSLDELLTCADSPSLPTCKRRTSNSATKNEIKELLSFMMVDSDLYGHMSNVLRNIAQSIGDEGSKFLIEVDKFNRKVAFKNLRRSLLTSLISSANRGITAKDRVFLAKMFFTVSRDDKKPWLYKWFVNESLDEESFNALVNYPTYVNSNFVKDSLALQNAIKENLVCKSQDGEEYIEINVRQHLETFLDKLSRSSFDDFQKYALQNTATLTTARAFCPILEEYTSEINYWKGGRQVTELYTLNFADVIASLGDFLGVETNYDLIRIITTASRGESSSDILYALELLGSESFQIFNELNKVILKESKGFYPLVLKSIKNINEDIFSQLGAIVLTLVDEENESKFKALSSVWNFWTEEEKDFLLLFLDEHLKGETNFVALFDFYADLMNEFPGVVEVIAKDLVGSEINLNKTFVALKDVVKQFRGKEVLDNFKEFYSRDQIVRIIEVISRGVQIDGPDIGAFEIDYVDNYVQAARETPFDFLWADSDIPTGSIVECIKEMSRYGQNFYTLIRQLPRACKESKNHEFTIRLFTWMDKIDKEYHSTNTRGDYQKGLFDELGFFSPAMMGTGISLLKFIQEEFGDTRDGFEYTVNKFKKYLFDLRLELTNQRGFIDSLELIVDQWNRLNKISGSNGRLHRSFIFKELALKEEWPRKKLWSVK